jgi:molybdopterin converting factor small subunit
MAKILIPTPLRQFADKKDSVQLTGSTVGEVLKSLTSEYADLRRHLYNDEGKLRSFVNVYVNDEDIRYLNKEATPLNDGDTVSIVPSIAGGSAGVAAPPAPPGHVVERRDPAL